MKEFPTKGYIEVLERLEKKARGWLMQHGDAAPIIQWKHPKEVLVIGDFRQLKEMGMVVVNEDGQALVDAMGVEETDTTMLQFRVVLEHVLHVRESTYYQYAFGIMTNVAQPMAVNLILWTGAIDEKLHGEWTAVVDSGKKNVILLTMPGKEIPEWLAKHPLVQAIVPFDEKNDEKFTAELREHLDKIIKEANK